MKTVNRDFVPHESHQMGEWFTTIRSPVGTDRFYEVRVCDKCGGEQMSHAAGHFAEYELTRNCNG